MRTRHEADLNLVKSGFNSCSLTPLPTPLTSTHHKFLLLTRTSLSVQLQLWLEMVFAEDAV